jgi:hypothetical protein
MGMCVAFCELFECDGIFPPFFSLSFPLLDCILCLLLPIITPITSYLIQAFLLVNIDQLFEIFFYLQIQLLIQISIS